MSFESIPPSQETRLENPQDYGRWADLSIDGKRLDRMIRMAEKKLKGIKDIDHFVRVLNSICYLTDKKVAISKTCVRLHELLDKLEKKNKITNHWK